jgi:hypothetical protein
MTKDYNNFSKDKSFEIIKEKTIEFAIKCAENTIKNRDSEYISDDGALCYILHHKCPVEMIFLMENYLHYFWKIIKEIRNIYDENYYKIICDNIDKLMDKVKDVVKNIRDEDKKTNIKKDYNEFYEELERLIPKDIKLELEFLFRCIKPLPISSMRYLVSKDIYENIYLKNNN